MDGAAPAVLGGWKTSGIYSYGAVAVSIGSHVVEHTQGNVGVGVLSYGYQSYDSYGYPGGLRMADFQNCEVRGGPGCRVLGFSGVGF